jgi:hypothetical protein
VTFGFVGSLVGCAENGLMLRHSGPALPLPLRDLLQDRAVNDRNRAVAGR